ncbi:hypothetical protein, partial [Brevundimonas sp.]|uniref:hypothetical protein n=1 Tax=Brevundimonas sp. TaxID=1871086 RepID=UPI002ED906D0
MSDPKTPEANGAPLNGQARPEPFRRAVTWGRPPATVFRTGPLPYDSTPRQPTAAAPARPAPPAGAQS